MINWIIAIFYFLESFGIFNLEQILTTNLLILLMCRGLYIVSYIFNYYKDYNNELEGDQKFFTKKKVLFFSLRQAIIFLFGMIFLPIAIFFSFYGLLLGAEYMKQIAERKSLKFLKLLGVIIKIFTPIIGILWFTFINVDYFSLAALATSLFAFLHFGLKSSSLTLSKLIERYNSKRLNRISEIAHLIILIIVLLIPTLILSGVAFYKPQEKQTYMVEMGDGMKLGTDVYFAPGSFGASRPVILVRTPYGKTGWADDLYLPVYTIQNYHLVVQDLRGTGDSEGGAEYLMFMNDYLDGVDTIEWIRSQSWCNGKIASAGVSALCLNQYYYAGMGPEGLLAQQLWFGTPEMFDHAVYQGSYHKSSVETWLKSTASSNYQYQVDTFLNYILYNRQNFNSTSLSTPIGPRYSNVSVYGIHVGGWYDHFLQGTIDGYIGYDDNGTARARGHQKLVMGPWTHGSVYGGTQGELTYPDNSNGFNLILNWETEIFDEALLGIPADWDGARVAYYLMGDVDSPSEDWNYWRYAYDWPLDYEYDEWFFTANNRLNKTSAGSINKNFTYLYDPRYPVPNLGGQNQPFDLTGPMDQSSIENRNDVLIFETPALAEAYETVGRIWGHLFITSNCTDTDFTVKLTDVYPDGRSMLITDGSLTTRSRYNYTTDVLMSGNQMIDYELWVDLWSTAYVFAPGHKIRVAISSSNYPRFGTNPNTGAPFALDYLNQNIANNTLLVGPNYNSSIILPRLVNMSTTHIIY